MTRSQVRILARPPEFFPSLSKEGLGEILKMLKYNPNLKDYSQKLRREMTESERKIWFKIRKRQIKGFLFFRQKPIGNHIVDFYCPKARLIIEIDGGQHYEADNEIADKKRDLELKGLGFQVIRFTNLEISNNIENVLENIYKILPNPPLFKGGNLNS
ncbi:MAG: hypothetical protein UV34_C0023G0005 [Parcubacteria group bacterium GW2011_GWB1_42_6]|nr:MAG: hypothetical protein UV34_C0023G0005 [Parcubacteria group bacterium GW2011_GWB1_42_6]